MTKKAKPTVPFGQFSLRADFVPKTPLPERPCSSGGFLHCRGALQRLQCPLRAIPWDSVLMFKIVFLQLLNDLSDREIKKTGLQ